MSTKKMLVLLALLVAVTVIFTACAGPQGEPGPAGPAGPEGPAGPAGPTAESASVAATDLTCTQCHHDTSLVSGKEVAWAASVHGSGPAAAYAGNRPDCTGCHSSSGFSHAVTTGVNNADPQESALANPGRIDCRACHNIHASYTSDDWALKTVEPVKLVALDATYDGGMGNLCANCHQQRTA